MNPQPLLSFYGDDFTGSTDAMESLARAGLRTKLFTSAPTREQLRRHSDLQAFGVAGITRSLAPDAMEAALRPSFEALKQTGVPIVHYKVCSTFDSSPAIGSIGRALEVGASVFGSKCVPIVVGAPSLGRHCVFGNLFAKAGAESRLYRLDRHPSMSKHPITPMDEADLRVHLGKQTDKKIGLYDLLQLNGPTAAFDAALSENEALLIDLLSEDQLARVGELLERCAKPCFIVGSSGVESALVAHWQKCRAIPASSVMQRATGVKQIIAVAGSCSPVTARQIEWATANGFVEIPVNVRESNVESVVQKSVDALKLGKSVILHTGMGKSEHRVDAATAKQIGPTLGKLLRKLLARAGKHRVLIAGGDTSGAIAMELGIESMEMTAELVRGSPLVKVSAPGSPADGIEMTFKGGQVGPVDFLGLVLGTTDAHG